MKPKKIKIKKYADQVLEEAFRAGIDYARHGANEQNCYFGLFSSPEKTKAWEDGSNLSVTELRTYP